MSRTMSKTLDNPAPLAVNQRDAARVMGVSVWTIKRWENKKLLTPKKVGGIKLYPYAQLERLMAEEVK